MRTILVCVLLIITFAAMLVAQQSQNAPMSPENWMRIRSENGEFSIEVPATYRFYVDKAGFLVSEPGSDSAYKLENMAMLNSFTEEALISVESYEGKKGAADAIYKADIFDKANIKKSQVKHDDFTIREVIENGAGIYMVRRYFASKTHIFILTAASRKGETPQIRHFLDSMIFTPDARQSDADSMKTFSSLRVSGITVDISILPKDQLVAVLNPPKKKQPDDPTVSKLLVLNKPRASYTDAAKDQRAGGSIALKLVFDADGFIPKITVLSSLPGGLLAQALFAVIRTKFLPKEINGKPVPVVVTFEYGFEVT